MSAHKSKSVTNIKQTSTLINQPLSCPWSSRAPTSSSASMTFEPHSTRVNRRIEISRPLIKMSCNNSHQVSQKLSFLGMKLGGTRVTPKEFLAQITFLQGVAKILLFYPIIHSRDHIIDTKGCNFGEHLGRYPIDLNVHSYYPVPPSTNLSSQNSTTQFFHFFRFMQLFPDVHPATLHTVLFMCKNDFFCAVDKLLYIQRLRQGGSNKGKPLRTYQNNLRTVQHPYWNFTQTRDKVTPQDLTDVVKKQLQKVIILPQEKNDQKSVKNVKPFVQNLNDGTKTVENSERVNVAP